MKHKLEQVGNVEGLIEVAQAQAGNVDAFGLLVTRFQRMALGYAYAILKDADLAEDAAQEAFLQAWRDVGKLREPSAFAGWLRRIVFKQCDRIRRRRCIEMVPLEDHPETQARDIHGAELLMQKEARDAVHEAIDSLPEAERTVTTLFYIDGYSQNEIAEFLETPVSTVNNRLHSSRKHLRKRMMPMVKQTIRSKAPAADKVGDRVRFLLGLADLLSAGIPILQALQQLGEKAKSSEIREMTRKVYVDVAERGSTLSAAFSEWKRVFPPMVVSIIRNGEFGGVIEIAARQAGEWLRNGRYQMEAYLFDYGYYFIQCAMEAGAEQIVIDSGRRSPNGSEEGSVEQVWIEYGMPDGSVRKAQPYRVPPGRIAKAFFDFKRKTIFNKRQKGDEIKGQLRVRFAANEDERLLPISYRPHEMGEEMRISLS